MATLSGRISTTTPRLPVVGKIKVGKKNDKGHPMSVDYFIATGDYLKQFAETYGDKPTSIKIVFVSDDLEQVCNEFYECRDNQGRLTGKGDGEKYYLFDKNVGKLGSYVEQDMGEDGTPQRDEAKKRVLSAGKWKHTLRLRFILPEVKGIYGQWELQTFGMSSSIPSIIASFDGVRALTNTITRIPFDLNVKKVKSNKPGVTSVYPVISLVPNLSMESQLALAEFVKGGTLSELPAAIWDEKKVLSLKQADNKQE